MISFPSDTKSIKDSIRDVIGQLVTFTMTGDATACPVCSGSNYYDGINEQSLDFTCTTCSGEYWITADTTSGIIGHVRWKIQDQPQYGQTGKTEFGDCMITIDIDDLTPTQITNIKNIEVGDRNLQPFRTIYRGVPTRDRIRFYCREFEKV